VAPTTTASETVAPADDDSADEPPDVLPLVQGTQVLQRGTTVADTRVEVPLAADPVERIDPWAQIDPVMATTILSVAALAALLMVPRVRLTVRRTFRRTGWKNRPF
jgi:hypothetical protein